MRSYVFAQWQLASKRICLSLRRSYILREIYVAYRRKQKNLSCMRLKTFFASFLPWALDGWAACVQSISCVYARSSSTCVHAYIKTKKE